MAVTRRGFLRRASVAGAALAAGCGDSGTDSSLQDVVDPGDTGEPDAAEADGLATPDDTTATTDAGPTEPLPEYSWDGALGPDDLFQYGVASGDPLQDSVILWTHLSTASTSDVDIFYEISTTPELTDIVAAGWDVALAERDHTLKVDPGGLKPGTTYYYRFRAEGRMSPIGRARTAPDGATARLRLGVCSCSKITKGWFLAYKELAAMPDIDAVLHLGDYFYESASSGHEPTHELITLGDYRTRYRQYRRDAFCQEMHRQHAFIPVWDDHESANDSWSTGASAHDPAVDGVWTERKAWAVQAWHEWMPVRDAPDRHIWRSFRFGDLVDLMMLDTRLWGRDTPAEPGRGEDLFDEARTMLGFDQEAWLADELMAAEARWQVLGQQVMFGQLKVDGGVLNPDQWDGYEATRQRVYDAVDAAGVENLVVMTGDIHTSWANDLCRDPSDPAQYDPITQAGSQGVELVVPGVTNGGFDELGGPVVLDLLTPFNPHIRWVDLSFRGYLVVDFDHDRVQCAWRHFESVANAGGVSHLGAVFRCDAGGQHLIEESEQVAAPDEAPALAP